MNRHSTRFPILAFVSAMLGCTASGTSDTASAHCGAEPADTSGWHVLTARYGVFSLLLPQTASEVPLQCFDSACGRIAVGHWTLGYDMGRMAGPGDSVRVYPGESNVKICEIEIAGRAGHLLTADRSSGRAARAAVPLGGWEGGLYLSADSLSASEVREFVAAVRSVTVPASQR